MFHKTCEQIKMTVSSARKRMQNSANILKLLNLTEHDQGMPVCDNRLVIPD